MSAHASRRRSVLLTGATGFVGSRMARRLLALGHDVRAIVRRSGAAPELAAPAYREIIGDFVDPAVTLPAARGCDVVLHCAATAGTDWDAVRRVNAEGTRTMVGASLEVGAERYVQISTVSVYDLAGLGDIDERAPLRSGGDPYGATKAEADLAVLDAAGRGLSATILRPGAILGFHPTSTWAVKVPSRIRDRAVKLLRDGSNTHPSVHVEDLVDATLLAIAPDPPPPPGGRVYNVVSHNGTWLEYADEVRSWFGGEPLPSMSEEESEGRAWWTGRVLSDRIRSELGWRPARTFAEGMREAESHWRSERTQVEPKA